MYICLMNMTNEIKNMELIDNRDFNFSLDAGKWWVVIYFNDGEDFLMSFNLKRDAVWFMNGGYNQFELR